MCTTSLSSKSDFRLLALILVIVFVKVCTKSFTNSQSLLRHSMSHTGTKPFSCDVCGKNFSQAATLKRHQRIHTSTLPRRKRGRKPVRFPPFNIYRTNRVLFLIKARFKRIVVNSSLGESLFIDSDCLSMQVCSLDNEGAAHLFPCPNCPSRFNTEDQLNHHK